MALMLYEKLLPGSQLVNRLQDLGWRVHVVHDQGTLAGAAEEHKPLLVFADLASSRKNVQDAIAGLRNNEKTKHVPVIAFTADQDQKVFDAALAAGATLVANDSAILQHLSQFIDQALSEF